MAAHSLKVFVDFDGTITRQDVGEAIFRKYGRREEAERIISMIKLREVTAREGWRLLFASAPGLTLEQITALLPEIEVDRSFAGFAEVCRTEGIPLFIVSDGFTHYIEQLLRREGITGIPVFANRLAEGHGGITPVFPYSDEECIDCANCKRNHVLDSSGEEEFTLYIGNGSSDVCPVRYCDYVFAKDLLLSYCSREKIPCFAFNHFSEVTTQLQTLLCRKRLKKRHQANLHRRAVYLQG